MFVLMIFDRLIKVFEGYLKAFFKDCLRSTFLKTLQRKNCITFFVTVLMKINNLPLKLYIYTIMNL